jgi:CBS domain containing-hemolysin-like protein
VVGLLATGHSRFPVVGASIDDPLGVVSITDLRDLDAARRYTTPVRDLTTPPVLIPTTMALPRALERLRAEHRQLAFVVDEHGGFAGILTLEDIAEELVGEIRDEDDIAEPVPVLDPDGSWLIPGRWRLDEIADATGVHLPESHLYETVAGLMMAAMGRMTRVGDEVRLPLPEALGADDQPASPAEATLQVVQLQGRVPRIVRMRIHR